MANGNHQKCNRRYPKEQYLHFELYFGRNGRCLEKGLRMLDSNDCGIIEVGVFATEDVTERIADEVGVANHQVGTMM